MSISYDNYEITFVHLLLMKDKILKQFDENSLLYTSFGDKCKGIIIELLKDNSIPIHHMTSRTKEKNSLERKIDSKGDKYNELSAITDLCGIRIITYLDSDVNKVAEIIEKEFDIDIINTIDKRKLKSDQFGYKSLHYVVSLNGPRINLSENKKYKALKVEIQVRSILQHAWAEIEHDLGYKGELAIPENSKRSFNRLAALLETADIEFDRLKRELFDYETAVKVNIHSRPNDVKVDQTSLYTFVSTSEIFEQALGIIKKNIGCEIIDTNNYSIELSKADFLKIRTIGALDRLLKENKNNYLKFVDLLTENLKYETLTSDVPLYYFLHFLAAKSNDEEYLKEYFKYGMQLSGKIDFIKLYNRVLTEI